MTRAPKTLLVLLLSLLACGIQPARAVPKNNSQAQIAQRTAATTQQNQQRQAAAAAAHNSQQIAQAARTAALASASNQQAAAAQQKQLLRHYINSQQQLLIKQSEKFFQLHLIEQTRRRAQNAESGDDHRDRHGDDNERETLMRRD